MTRLRLLAVVAVMTVAACGGGGRGDGAGGGDDDGGVAPVAVDASPEERAAIVAELLSQPEERSGIVRFAIRSLYEGDTVLSVEGVADYDRQRYVSRLESNGPDTTAIYDQAVVGGFVYEKLLAFDAPGRTPTFTPQWLNMERWASETDNSATVPYVPVPFVGEPRDDVRRDLPGLDAARRRQIIEAVISQYSRVGTEPRRGQPAVHYRVTFERERARSAAQDEVASGLLSLPEIGPDVVVVEIWLDDQGRLREYGTESRGARWEYELWDYGQPAPVELPDDLTLRD